MNDTTRNMAQTREVETGEAEIPPPALPRGTGAAYVVKYLHGEDVFDENWFDENWFDENWIAESIDSGALVACPRCHFLHLPAWPFPPRMILDMSLPAPPDTCDVCANVRDAIDGSYHDNGLKGLLADDGELATQRGQRAATLYNLWIGGLNGATTWLEHALARAVREVMEASGQVNVGK